MSQGLPVASLINVVVNLTPAGALALDIDSLLILGPSQVIDMTTRMREYSSLAGVALDFANNDPEYLAAELWFEQSPSPENVFIGAWAKTATHGELIGGTLSTTQQLIATWAAITNGSFTTVIDGTSHNITGLSFSGQTNLNGVASIIQAALPSGVTMTWNANYEYFVMVSSTTGTSSTVAFLTTEGTGTDISGMLAMTATSSGAMAVPGYAAETALSAVETFDTKFSSQWYGLDLTGGSDSDAEAIAPYIEADSISPHYFFWTTSEAGVLSPSDTSDIAYVLAQNKYKKTGVQFSSNTPHAFVSAAARILTTQWLGSQTTITLMYKQEPGVIPELLNTVQAQSVAAKNCNVYVDYNNGTSILQTGISSSGDFIDTIIGLDWLSNFIQTTVYNLLYTSLTKIPQTDAGMHLINLAIQSALQQAVVNGLLAPGTWNSGGFGQLNQGDLLQNGYYIYQPPLATQPEANRAARQSVPFQVAAKLAGAVHDVMITVNVNQ